MIRFALATEIIFRLKMRLRRIKRAIERGKKLIIYFSFSQKIPKE